MSSGPRSARSISCEQSGAISAGTGASVAEPPRPPRPPLPRAERGHDGAHGSSDFELERLVALCPPCHTQTDAPYVLGRLVVTRLRAGPVNAMPSNLWSRCDSVWPDPNNRGSSARGPIANTSRGSRHWVYDSVWASHTSSGLKVGQRCRCADR